MTEAEIHALPAGPDLDALVATRVFGMTLDRDLALAYAEMWWKTQPLTRYFQMRDPRFFAEPGHPELFHWDLSPYSTDIAAAWQVMEHLRAAGRLHGVSWSNQGYKAMVASRSQMGSTLLVQPFNSFHAAVEKTAPLAICRAALLGIVAI